MKRIASASTCEISHSTSASRRQAGSSARGGTSETGRARIAATDWK
jgi:hypothetical protein